MAVADRGGAAAGRRVEVIAADHQSKPEVGEEIAREWYAARGVDAIVDISQTNIALAVSNLTHAQNKVLMTGAASIAFTNEACSTNTLQWSHDTHCMSYGPSHELVAQGKKKWFYLAVDYTFGRDLVATSGAIVKQAGGSVAGAVYAPLGSTDMSAYINQAMAASPDVICVASAGDDVNVAVKQAVEFGVPQSGVSLATLFAVINNVHAIGLETAQGLYATESFYWNLNDATRAFAKRWSEVNKKMPNLTQAAHYAATLHYMKVLDAVGEQDPGKMRDGRFMVHAMKATPTEDPVFGKAYLRADGRHIHSFYLFQVKTPAESKQPWDYYSLVKTFPGEEAYLKLDPAKCKLLGDM